MGVRNIENGTDSVREIQNTESILTAFHED